MPDRLLGIPDPEIVAELRKGNETIFERLFRAYYQPLGAFARTYVYRDDIAEEIVCDVFTYLWSQRREWNTTGTVQSYLYASVRNRAMNYVRDIKRSDSRIENLAAAGVSPGHSAPQDAPGSHIDNADERRAFKHAWETLNEQQREVITLRYFRSMGFDEIATILGVTRQAAEKQVGRAMQALRKGLPPGFP